MTISKLYAPFPYYGGKRRIASRVWEGLGPVDTYIELFGGSLAVLLSCPFGPRKKEIVNDLDGFVTNFWRSIKFDPEKTAAWADYPTVHIDLVARKEYLNQLLPTLVDRLIDDPFYCSYEVAGWWVWAVSNNISLANFSDYKTGNIDKSIPVIISRQGGKGVSKNRLDKSIPRCYKGNGVSLQRKDLLDFDLDGRRLLDWFNVLSIRLSKTFIFCKDWDDIVSPTITGTTKSNNKDSTVGFFLDPPYGTENRTNKLYNLDSKNIADKVKSWSIKYGNNPRWRICVAGYFDDYKEWPENWQVVKWGSNKRKYAQGDEKERQECLWFSPFCQKIEQNQLL